MELEVCHDVYYLLFPVGKHCVSFKRRKDELTISGFARSGGLLGLFGDVEVRGKSEGVLERFSRFFELYVRARGEEVHHLYRFSREGVHYVILRNGKKEKGFVRTDALLDPFRAGLFVFLRADGKERRVKFFYDGRVQSALFRAVGRETLEWRGKVYNCVVVRVLPRVKTSGLLAPRGEWKVWVEERLRFAVRMKVSFKIGSVNAWVSHTKGELGLLTRAGKV
ncbi:MAG: DUF3108 domain-containing protein [Aquificae bacterium]|nr:DUF3108 domain-containing protein [Aquificota bacterium]